MLTWAVIFLIIAIVAALFGFAGIANVSTQIAKVLFFIFLILFIVSLIYHFSNREPVPVTTTTLNFHANAIVEMIYTS